MFQKIKKNPLVRRCAATMPSQLRPHSHVYRRTLKFIETSEKWTTEQHQAFQFQKIKELIQFAWEETPGYKNLWQSAGFTPDKFKNLRDIERIPFVTKEILQNDLKSFSFKGGKGAVYLTTGGSTGEPLGFFNERKDAMMEMAFIHSIWKRQFKAISLATKSTWLRGKKLSAAIEKDPLDGLFLSSYDINVENVRLFLREIEQNPTPILQAYPSALYLMAKIIDSEGLHLRHQFDSIMLGSEPLYDFQKILIRKVFNTKLSFWYGHTEKAVLAGNCESDDHLHIFPQYGLTEIVDGEIIGTSFWIRATPFIRYRTSDYAKIVATKCEKCGRHYPLFESIDGRLQEFIVGRSKKLVSMTAINMHDEIFDEIQQFRFYQDQIGKVCFQFVPKMNQIANEAKIYSGLKAKLSDEFDLEFRKIESIPKTESGKLRFLDQKLDISQFI